MRFDSAATRRMIEAIAASVIEHADELTALDRAIGDADHGANLERGFGAVLEHIDEIAVLPINAALDAVGTTLILQVGGASGPLYGKLFSTIGRNLRDPENLTRAQLVGACSAAVEVVKALGRSDVGHKTMLDVLVPALESLGVPGDGVSPAEVRERARRAAGQTVPMVAQRGRAAYLGARSSGHMDPGARSAQLMVDAVCDFLEARG